MRASLTDRVDSSLPVPISVLLALSLFAPHRASDDTLRIASRRQAPSFDGVASREEYGAPTLTLAMPAGPADVWIVRAGGAVYVAARLRDDAAYWGDDFVLALDPDGSGGEQPGDGDLRLIVRRTADSSVVTRAAGGRWEPAGGARTVGRAREGDGWALRVREAPGGWSAEVRIDTTLFRGAEGRAAALALRAFDDHPVPFWGAWPPPPPETPPLRQERSPRLWARVEWR